MMMMFCVTGMRIRKFNRFPVYTVLCDRIGILLPDQVETSSGCMYAVVILIFLPHIASASFWTFELN